MNGLSVAPDPCDATTEPLQPDLEGRTSRVIDALQHESAKADRQASFPVATLEQLRRSGLLGLLVPTSLGGLGGGMTDMVQVTMALGRHDVSTALIFAMHCQQVATIERYASEPLRASLLTRVAEGDLYIASVTTEVGTGGSLLSAEQGLTESNGTLKMERVAPIVTGGAHADGYLITMQAAGSESDNQVSLVYADREQVEATVIGPWDPLGMRASHSVPMRLRADLPVAQIIGPPGGFREMAVQVFAPMAHLGWSAAWIGAASGALSRVLHVLRGGAGKSAFELSSPLLLQRLASARGDVETSHALLRHTLDNVAGLDTDLSRPPVQSLLNTLKIRSSELCFNAVDTLVDAVGMRHGYLAGSPTGLEQSLRDLRSASLNFHNDRLSQANGRLSLMDREVCLV